MEESSDLLVDVLEHSGKESESDVVSEKTVNELVDPVDNSTDRSNDPKPSSENLSKPVKHLRLPFSKIKQIMKMDPDVILVQQDAVFLVSKATEMFIEFLTRETNKQLAGNKRKTVMKRDVDVTIESLPQLCFLDGALE